jgi:hypothetical protein
MSMQHELATYRVRERVREVSGVVYFEWLMVEERKQ